MKMKIAWILGIGAAVMLHAGFILFGGLIFNSHAKGEGVTREVELVSDLDTKKDEPKKEPEPQKEEIKTDEEPPPDASEVMKKFEEAEAAKMPGLDSVDLGAMADLLKGAGGGEFGQAFSLAGGGVIGGTGGPRSVDSKTLDKAFDPSDLDQKPRAVYQVSPTYPSEMRGQKVDGVVSVIFIVDASGKVTNPAVQKASHDAFKTPALDAVRQWKFEPGIRGGQRVACKMRVSIRFQRS